MRKILFLTLLLLAFSQVSLAASGVAADPSAALLGSRQLGLGNASLGFPADAASLFANPAGLSAVDFPQFTASSRKILLDETQYSLLGWVIPTKYGNFGLGFIGMGTTGSNPTTRDPASGRITLDPSLEASSYSNSLLAITYSKQLPTKMKISLGGNLKFFNQAISGGNISDKGTATNIDLGISAQPLNWLAVGANIQNLLGGTLKWTSTEDNLNRAYQVGGAIYLQDLLVGLTLDLNQGLFAGLEYFPLKSLVLRGGLSQSSPTLGLGFINGGFRFDYAYAQRPDLPGDNPHYFSISYIGERVFSVNYALKTKSAHLRLLYPKDRLITPAESINFSAEAWAAKAIDQVNTWTVTGVGATFETQQKIELEKLDRFFVNGKETKASGTFEVQQPLQVGRNVFYLVGQVFPEVISPKKSLPASVVSAEVKILRTVPFTDVPPDFWAMEPIALDVALGLVTGYPDNTFKPEKGITRAELIALLVRSLGVRQTDLDSYATYESFGDVTSDNWAAKYIIYGNSANFVSGYPDGDFKPNKVLNRAEAVTIMARYAGLKESATNEAVFSDLNADFWANKFIGPAKNNGLLNYLEGKEFKPAEDFTRAEACEVLYRVSSIRKKVEAFWQTGITSALP